MKTQIATTVNDDDLEKLNKLAEVEDTSIARILRRGARREITEHERDNLKLINGKTRTAQRAAEKSKRQRQSRQSRGKVAATA